MSELYDWDPAKSALNWQKHGVSFEEATTVFGDDDALIKEDASHADSEDRLIIIGLSGRSRMLLTVFTIRDEETVRIISSRPAEPHERRTYEQEKRSKHRR